MTGPNHFLFVVRSYPDIDHMAPMIWTCLEEGDRTAIVFEYPYDYKRDYRIAFLLKYPRFRVVSHFGNTSSFRIVRGLSRILWNARTLQSFLIRNQISACFFEWGDGVAPSEGGVGFFSQLRQLPQP